jgi:hypothetical protein
MMLIIIIIIIIIIIFLFSKYLQSVFIFKVRDQILHPYTTTAKITFVY